MAILDLAAFVLMLINSVVVPIVFTIAFLLFIVGAYRYFFSQENSKNREEGRKFVLSAVLGFFFMISIWGLVNVLVNTFGFNQANRPNLPYFGGSSMFNWGPSNNSFGGDLRADDCRRPGAPECPSGERCFMITSNYYACHP